MGPVENRTSHPARRAARRRCLLKGCEQRFHPRQARQRYCSERRQEAARKWPRWRAQQRYRATTSGKQRRNGQSQRYRKRIQSRKPAQPEAVDAAARVITKNFFRAVLRPARLLHQIRARERRSPLQRFCLQACRRALERVEQRERHWKQAPELVLRY